MASHEDRGRRAPRLAHYHTIDLKLATRGQEESGLITITQRKLALAASALSLVLWGHQSAGALEDGQRIRDWTARCETPEGGGDQRCLIHQTVFADDEQPVLDIKVGYLVDSGQPAALITVPLGVALRTGMGFQVDDGEAVRLAFNHCNPVGCVAALVLDDAMIRALKRGRRGKIDFALINGQTVPLEISLLGFTRGFEGLEP